ncbi:unnamed protein product [Chondrus crispus]|uniref:Uncharacterized protein n=1 Tax=Chondrus crispus TaxID=2769 RepID=R7Q7G4_CHOCR|nr:unnamed protein product [Chondrus crispus]CDF33773.1 unnamed protein product [Chondrus crispus]|eukprot:XP_005713592.1 unnamed protein product [Chondrus crispus]
MLPGNVTSKTKACQGSPVVDSGPAQVADFFPIKIIKSANEEQPPCPNPPKLFLYY